MQQFVKIIATGEIAVSDAILVDKHGTWAELTLNRPAKLNCFNEEMHVALRSAIEDARDQGLRAILITGSGRGFCAGQDLGNRDPAKMTAPPDLGETLSKFYNPLIRLIRSLNFPVICAVNGVAAGAGANIALACDIVLASENAKFVQSFANVGLIPDAGGSWTLARLVGEARAKALTLTSEPISATQAADWGMIWKALPEGQLLPEARELTARLGNGPTIGLGKTKHLIQDSHSRTLTEHLDVEAREQKQCGVSPDYAEGVTAFLEKRQPQFRGSL